MCACPIAAGVLFLEEKNGPVLVEAFPTHYKFTLAIEVTCLLMLNLVKRTSNYYSCTHCGLTRINL
jgi:hypothetical protein